MTKTVLLNLSHYTEEQNDAENIIRLNALIVCFRLATVFGNSYRMRSDLLVNNFVYTAVNKSKLTLFEHILEEILYM